MGDELRESLQILIDKFDYNTVTKALEDLKLKDRVLQRKPQFEKMARVFYLRKKGKTFPEIGNIIGLSASRCGQLHAKMLRLLKHRDAGPPRQIALDEIIAKLESEDYGS